MQAGPYIETCIAALYYEGIVRESLLRYKFEGMEQYSDCFGELLAAAISARLPRPHKQKRRTRATIAKEKGLEPLAQAIFAQEKGTAAPEVLAGDFLDADRGVETVEDALSGASDIIAEWISDNAAIRKALRELMMRQAFLVVKNAKEDEDSVYRLYYDFSQSVSRG